VAKVARADGMKIVVTGVSGYAVSVAAASAVVDKATPVVDPDAYAAIHWLGELMLKDAAVTRVWWSFGHIETDCRASPQNLCARRSAAFHLDRPFSCAADVADMPALGRRAIELSWSGFDAVVFGTSGAVTVCEALTSMSPCTLGTRPRRRITLAPRPAGCGRS
jgi:hypothetical protein